MQTSSPISNASPFKPYEATSPAFKTPAASSSLCILADCTPVTATPGPSPYPNLGPSPFPTPDSVLDEAPLFSLADLAPPLDALLLTEPVVLRTDFVGADKENRPPVHWNPRHVAADLRDGGESPLVVVSYTPTSGSRTSTRAPLRDITESYRSPHRNVSVNLWRVSEMPGVSSPIRSVRRTRAPNRTARRALASMGARSKKRSSLRMMR